MTPDEPSPQETDKASTKSSPPSAEKASKKPSPAAGGKASAKSSPQVGKAAKKSSTLQSPETPEGEVYNIDGFAELALDLNAEGPSPWPSPSPYIDYDEDYFTYAAADSSDKVSAMDNTQIRRYIQGDILPEVEEEKDDEFDSNDSGGSGATSAGENDRNVEVYDTSENRPVSTSIFLLIWFAIAIADTATSVLLTIRWFTSGKRTYFWMSVGIMIVATAASIKAGCNLRLAYLGPLTQVVLLSLPSFTIRLCVIVGIGIYTIVRGGMRAYYAPSFQDGGRSIWTAVQFFKLGQVFFESIPQLALQAYVFVREFKNLERSSSIWILLVFSIATSVLSIVSGLVDAYFKWEEITCKIMLSLFFLMMLASRCGAIVAAFLEFRVYGLVYVMVMLLTRLFVCIQFRIININRFFRWPSDFACLMIILLVLTLCPFGSEVKHSLLLEDNDRYRGIELAFGFVGNAVLTFRQRLCNDFSVALILLHGAETLTMILIAAVVGALRPRFSHTGLNPLVVCWYVISPLALAGIFYYLAWLSVVVQERRWIQTLDEAIKSTTGPEGRRRNMLLAAINRRHSRWNNVIVKQVRGGEARSGIAYVPALLHFCSVNFGTHFEFEDIGALLAKVDFMIWKEAQYSTLNRLKPGGLKLLVGDVTEADLIQVREIVLHAIKVDNVRPALRSALKHLTAELKVRIPTDSKPDIADSSEMSSVAIE